MIQIRKTLNILLRKEVVYNKDCTLKGNPCLIITSLPYLIRTEGKRKSIRRRRRWWRIRWLHAENKGELFIKLKSSRLIGLLRLKHSWVRRFYRVELFVLFLFLIVAYSLLYKGWVWLFVGLSVSKSCNKRWVWPFGEINWSQSRE